MNSENKELIFNGKLTILSIDAPIGTWPNRQWILDDISFDDNLDGKDLIVDGRPGDIFLDISRNRFELIGFTGASSDQPIIQETPWDDVITEISPPYTNPELSSGFIFRPTPNCELFQHGRPQLGIDGTIVEYLSQKANYQIEQELCGTGPTGRARFAQNILGSTSAIAPFDGQTGGIPGDRPNPIQGDEWINPVTDERYIFNGSFWEKAPGPFPAGLSTVTETGAMGNVFFHDGDPDDAGTPIVTWDTPFRFDPDNSGSSRIVPSNGSGNTVDGGNSSILAGTDNIVGPTGSKSAILAGMGNTVNGGNSTVLGGMGNIIDLVTSITGAAPVDATGPIIITGDGTADNSVILGGDSNTIIHDNAVVMGDEYQSHEDNSMNIGGCAYIKTIPKADLSSFIGTTGSTGAANNICNLLVDCSISSLGDVDTSGVTTGKYLRYDGADWVDAEITNISSDSYTVSGSKSAVMATDGCTVSGIESAIIGSDSCTTTTDNTVILGTTSVTHNVANSVYAEVLYTASGTVMTSDERKKKDIKEIEVSDPDQYLEKVINTKTYGYRYQKEDDHAPLRHGFIAQRLLETFPHTVKTHWRKPHRVVRENDLWIPVESKITLNDEDHVEVDLNNPTEGKIYRDEPLKHYSLDPIQLQQVSWVAIQQLIEKNKQLTERCQNLEQRIVNLE